MVLILSSPAKNIGKLSVLGEREEAEMVPQINSSKATPFGEGRGQLSQLLCTPAFVLCQGFRAFENALKNVLFWKETSSERFPRVEDQRQLCPSEGEVCLESWQSGGEDTSKHIVFSC